MQSLDVSTPPHALSSCPLRVDAGPPAAILASGRTPGCGVPGACRDRGGASALEESSRGYEGVARARGGGSMIRSSFCGREEREEERITNRHRERHTQRFRLQRALSLCGGGMFSMDLSGVGDAEEEQVGVAGGDARRAAVPVGRIRGRRRRRRRRGGRRRRGRGRRRRTWAGRSGRRRRCGVSRRLLCSPTQCPSRPPPPRNHGARANASAAAARAVSPRRARVGTERARLPHRCHD